MIQFYDFSICFVIKSLSLTATILIYGLTASEFDFSKISDHFGSFPALVATPLLITAISTSDNARAVCCASTAVIFKCFGFDVISFTVPANPKSFSVLLNQLLLIV